MCGNKKKKEENMIITGYQGIGKSTLANKRPDIIDLESSCFWKTENGVKTRPDDWYVYYCQMAEHLSRRGYIVFVSYHPEVREYLENHGTEPFCAIFPVKSIKEDINTTKKEVRELDKKVALLDASIRSAHKRMDSAGIGRADLIEHIEHEKIERNEHHGE